MITGVNLGILLEAIFMKDTMEYDELVSYLIVNGKNGIRHIDVYKRQCGSCGCDGIEIIVLYQPPMRDISASSVMEERVSKQWAAGF